MYPKSFPHSFRPIKATLLLLLIIFIVEPGFSCSMYKVTVAGKTMVGCNEDAWRLTPRIWFENRTTEWKYGAAFTGSRFDGANGFAPQSGMNESGLTFSRLASYYPATTSLTPENKKTITNPTLYLKDILHTCKTVEDVQNYISKFDHSYFIEDVFIYIDQSGKYLIVEPYSTTIGDNPKYVLSNFCPSITSENDALQLNRYRNGVTFLKNKIDTTLNFCTALSDTMHVCRKKIGDGTLLTSIWDTKNGLVNLYFYHDYTTTVQFNLKSELEKGDHAFEVPALFPPNAEFEKLRDYKIPQNNLPIMLFLILSGGLFLFSSFFFLISYIKTRKHAADSSFVKLLFFPLGIVMFSYMFILCRTINIYYFPAPYEDPASVVISVSSFIPFLILLLIFPLCYLNKSIIEGKSWNLFPRLLFTVNNITLLILVCLFTYWGFYSVFK